MPHPLARKPLLDTKLYVPDRRADLVPRPRLIDRLHEGLKRKLLLISAPAGFGKTTLLAEWLAGGPAGRVAAGWISLDHGDNDPASFWAYFIAALQRVREEVGEHSLSLLHSSPVAPVESVLTTLINEIGAVEDDFALVLDDYHVIDTPEIHQGLSFLLDRLPPRMHVVITTRSDPPLPLARLRARAELTELRTADLRFTQDEAAAFLNRVMALDLAPEDVAALEQRTEGWIAGLRLAALSVQDRQDAHSFVAAFAGDNRYIVDFLVEEVLHRQSEPVRSFLLQTSVLDRLTGSLCDAVTDGEGGRAVLEMLERCNLFVVALDDQRRWFRYHHLFADVLLARLREENPDRVSALHRRASGWYEQNGLLADAVRHALAAEDMARAAELIDLVWPAMEANNQESTWLGWAKALPDALVRARPGLGMGCVWALLNTGEIEAAAARLLEVEQWLARKAVGVEGNAAKTSETVASEQRRFPSLPAEIATLRAYLAQAVGDLPGTIESARRALDLLTEGDHLARAPADSLLALACWARGDLDSAHHSHSAAMASLSAAGDELSAIGGSFVLADIEAAQGRLRRAIRTCEQALRSASKQEQPVFPGLGELNLALSELHRERGDLAAAIRHLETFEELRARADYPHSRHRGYTVRARLEGTRGNLAGALELLDEAERAYFRSPVPQVRPIGALRARVRIAQGQPSDALDWARERGLSAGDELSYLREFEHITLAKALIARHETANTADDSIQEAVRLLERLLIEAERGGRTGSAIETLVLQSLAQLKLGSIARALRPLERALTLAEPEGYVRIFVDEGDPMRDLLRHAAAAGIAGTYTRHLLSAFDPSALASLAPSRTVAAALTEPLTPRELEILRLIAAGMRTREIADHLVISAFTVKRHIANAYEKLNVRHRAEAVSRANALDLL